MHPIGHLFQDIYRNYWGITPGTEQPERRRANDLPARKHKQRATEKSRRKYLRPRAPQRRDADRYPAGNQQGTADRRRHREQPRAEKVAGQKIAAEQKQAR